jgi:hypothetical protein
VVARNVNEATVEPMVESGKVCIWQESVVRRFALCWGVWPLRSFHVKLFKRNCISVMLSMGLQR